jgi:hypothetical protein
MAQPVVVPRSRARIVREGSAGIGIFGVAPMSALARVRSAMGGLLFWWAARVEDDGG